MKRFGVLFLALSAILLVLSCRVYRQTDEEERERGSNLLSFFGSAHKLSSPLSVREEIRSFSLLLGLVPLSLRFFVSACLARKKTRQTKAEDRRRETENRVECCSLRDVKRIEKEERMYCVFSRNSN